MKIFFAASTKGIPKYKNNYENILDTFRERGDTVLETWVVTEIRGGDYQMLSSKELLLNQLDLIHDCDLMVIETTLPSFGIGYLIHEALSKRKPILCLYPASSKLEPLSDLIKGSTSSLLTLMQYNQEALREQIEEFCTSLRDEHLYKFNFLASEDILEFIEKGAKQEGKSKSEFLRDKIKKELIDGSDKP